MDRARFEYLEKRHDELMKIAEENTAIMHEINQMNIFKNLWNHINGNWNRACDNSKNAIEESKIILKELGSFESWYWYVFKQ